MSNILIMLQLFHNKSDVGTVDGCFVDKWVPKNLSVIDSSCEILRSSWINSKERLP